MTVGFSDDGYFHVQTIDSLTVRGVHDADVKHLQDLLWQLPDGAETVLMAFLFRQLITGRKVVLHLPFRLTDAVLSHGVTTRILLDVTFHGNMRGGILLSRDSAGQWTATSHT